MVDSAIPLLLCGTYVQKWRVACSRSKLYAKKQPTCALTDEVSVRESE